MWEPRRLATLWASTACYRDIFTFLSPHLLAGTEKSPEEKSGHSMSRPRFEPDTSRIQIRSVTALAILLGNMKSLFEMLPVCTGGTR
jgi:hypothetical protein